jgi:hypothetical protein
MNPVDISTETNAICTKLELEPRLVAMMIITPHNLHVETYDTNETGTKYVDPNTGEIVITAWDYEVTT